jgi:ABC-2 type transport system permease protein
MRVAFTVMLKDLLLLQREPHALLFTVAFPFVFGVFFGAIYSSSANGEASVPVAIVDLDGGEASADLLGVLRASSSLEIAAMSDAADAEHAVRRGSIAAAIIVRAGFGERLASFDRSAGLSDVVTVVVDPSRPGATVTESVLTGMLGRLRGERLADRLSGGADPSALLAAFDASHLVQRRDITERLGRPLNAYEITFAQSMVWAMMGCAAAFAVSLVRERQTGTLVRLRLAPGGAWWGLLGKALACFVTAMVVAVGFAGLGVAAFGVTIENAAMLAAAVAAGSACFAGVMMLLAVLARGQGSPGQLAWGVLLVLAITGGAMLPLAFMPGWLAALSVGSPVRWAILAVEGSVWREFGWLDAAGPLTLLLGVGVACFVLGGLVFSRERAGTD